MTAQRLLTDLLPKVGTPDAPAYDLDLTGATLEYCDLSYRVMGQIRFRAMKLYQSNSFHHCEIRGLAWFTNTESWGRLHLHHMEFHDTAWFSRMHTRSTVDFTSTVFHRDAVIKESTFDGPVDFGDTVLEQGLYITDTKFTGPVTPPAGWTQVGQSLEQPPQP